MVKDPFYRGQGLRPSPVYSTPSTKLLSISSQLFLLLSLHSAITECPLVMVLYHRKVINTVMGYFQNLLLPWWICTEKRKGPNVGYKEGAC